MSSDRKNIDIYETRLRVYARDNYACRYCGRIGANNLQMAHQIAKTESNKKSVKEIIKYEYQKDLTDVQAWEIINHDDNLITSCSLCNSYFNIGFNPLSAEKLIKQIYEKLYESKP